MSGGFRVPGQFGRWERVGEGRLPALHIRPAQPGKPNLPLPASGGYLFVNSIVSARYNYDSLSD